VLALIGFVGLCLLVGAADGAIIAEAQRGWYLSLVRPPGTPPNWLFGSMWSAVHIMIGVAGWLVWRRSIATRPLRLWGWLLATNVFWAPAFFAVHSPLLALAINLALLAQTVVTALAFARVQRPAAWLLAPYFIWTGYVTYLTAGFWWLNQI
jgi:translocator protein